MAMIKNRILSLLQLPDTPQNPEPLIQCAFPLSAEEDAFQGLCFVIGDAVFLPVPITEQGHESRITGFMGGELCIIRVHLNAGGLKRVAALFYRLPKEFT